MAPPTPIHLSQAQARAARLAAQGLGGSDAASDLVPTLESTGWVRTLGGVDVYLALRARYPSLSRAELDGVVERGLAKVLPAARGCIYLVPGSQGHLALRLAERLSSRRIAREHEKAGIEPREIEAVGEAVLAALAGGPLTTHALRRALPEGTVRSLGDLGKKLGISSTLPPALRHLEFDGRIERTLEGGRLDTERYLWRLTDGDAQLPGFATDEELHSAVAKVFFRAAGPVTRRHWAAWSGLGQRDAQRAIDRAGLVAIQVADIGEDCWLDVDLATIPQASPAVALLPCGDNLIAYSEGPAFFVEPGYHAIPVPVWGRGKGSTLGDVRHSTLRSVVVGDRIVGFWEFDPAKEEVIFACFAPVDGTVRQRLQEEADAVGDFIAKQLGHGRSFSIDTEKQLEKRCEYVRKLRAGW